MTMKVPMTESGMASEGMSVARTLRRKRKMTMTTSAIARTRVNSTSWTEARMERDLSERISRRTEGGICARKVGRSAFTASTTATVFVPGCFCTERTMPRVSRNQLATLSFSTLSITRPSWARRTGEPWR